MSAARQSIDKKIEILLVWAQIYGWSGCWGDRKVARRGGREVRKNGQVERGVQDCETARTLLIAS